LNFVSSDRDGTPTHPPTFAGLEGRCPAPPKHERRSVTAPYAEIKAAGYDGGYTRVTDFIRGRRQGEGQGAAINAFSVPRLL
jgi:hypothetical protein